MLHDAPEKSLAALYRQRHHLRAERKLVSPLKFWRKISLTRSINRRTREILAAGGTV